METSSTVAAIVEQHRDSIRQLANLMRDMAQELRNAEAEARVKLDAAKSVAAIHKASVEVAHSRGGADALAVVVKALDKAVGRKAA